METTEEIQINDTPIHFTEEINSFLSNSSTHGFFLDGVYWKSVEYFFQAQKYAYSNEYVDEIMSAPSSKEAFHIGRKYPPVFNWNKIKDHVMRRAIIAKFKTHPDIRKKLLSSDSYLIKLNKKDAYWGSGENGGGQNKLGKLLIEAREVFRSTAVLESEHGFENVEVDDIYSRFQIGNFFRKMPDLFFSHLRHFEPQSGCFNQCSFCSQNPEKKVLNLMPNQLRNIIAALKRVSVEVAKNLCYISDTNPFNSDGKFSSTFKMPSLGLLGYQREKAGIIYCYYDNDISSYNALNDYIKYCFEDLGLKTRISTIGYSRKNEALQKMHIEINSKKQYLSSLGAVRLSFSHYSPGWISNSKLLSKYEFIADSANFLKTYKPAFNYLGPGERRFCVELRSPPSIKTSRLTSLIVSGRHVIHCSNYLLLSQKPHSLIPISEVEKTNSHSVKLTSAFKEYLMINSDALNNVDIEETAKLIINSNMKLPENLRNAKISDVKVFALENADGLYYAVDPSFDAAGLFRAKQFYPQTANRAFSGYIDSERFFLNALLLYKLSKGLSKKDAFSNAGWEDVESVIDILWNKVNRLKDYDSHAANYLETKLLPLLVAYVQTLKIADYAPSLFFDKNFTIDTGQICNMGRAVNEYKAITQKTNLPLTPQHEKSFGGNSRLAIEKRVWRLSVKSFENQKSIYCEEQDLEKNWADTTGSNLKIVSKYTLSLDSGIYQDEDWKSYKMPGTI